MDINSLLSPEESPSATSSAPAKAAARKPRKSRTSKTTSLAQAPLTSQPPPPPVTLPCNALQQASPPAPNASPRVRMGTIGTPPADGVRTPRQTSTPGMDTLADLASMQHHQQTARVNAGGLRTSEIYDSQGSSTPSLPALQSMSSQGSTRIRGASFDTSMTEATAPTPSPRVYTTGSLAETDLQMVTQLVAYLATNPFAYESHVQLINTLHKGLLNHIRHHSTSSRPGDPHTYDLLRELQSARESMNSRFAMGEDLWADWIQDRILLARSLNDRVALMELCQKAVEEEMTSSKLWLIYAQWMLSLYKNTHANDERVSSIGTAPRGEGWSEDDANIAADIFGWAQLMSVWKRGAQETAWRINDSQLLWDPYTELLLQELASSTSHEAVLQVQEHFLIRLQIPHATWDQTSQLYSTFVSTYDSVNYEVTMIDMNKMCSGAKQKYEWRDFKELNILRASQIGDQESELRAFYEYIDYELSLNRKKHAFDFDLANALYQRATLRFPAQTDLWEAYIMFMTEEITSHGNLEISTLPVLEKATRHCPWSGVLWSQYLLAAETNSLPFYNCEEIKHKATSTGLLEAGGMDEVLKVHTAWCGFLRRRAFRPDSTEEDQDVAEVGIRSALEDVETQGRNKFGNQYPGDPQYRLEKIYIKYLTQCRSWGSARDQWRKLISRQGDSYDFWIRYYIWEMTTWSKLAYNESEQHVGRTMRPTEATQVLQQALKRPNLDWPEKLLEIFQYHCEDHEDAKTLQSVGSQIYKIKKSVAKRREKEHEAARAYAVQQEQHVQQGEQDAIHATEDHGTAGKRKRDHMAEDGPSKRSRPEEIDESEPQVQQQDLAALKRDRENSTIVVRNLPTDTSETRIRQYFRDCGTINSLRIIPEEDGHSAIAFMEFESKDDVLAAQTRNMKQFEGRPIEIQVGSGSTLYVANFPPTADESWVRNKFKSYGEILDVRFPSLKYNTHRRFCYLQFKFPSQAQAATKLDGESLGDDLSLVAKISDPTHKQSRQGAIYDGRELYLANVHWGLSEKNFEELFSKYGTVEKVRIPLKVDGRPKGIAFVVFSTKDAAAAALDMHLTVIRGRPLNVFMSTNEKSKRQTTRIVTSTSERASNSPIPDQAASINGDSHGAASPTPPAPNRSEIQSRTIGLLNLPDTVNDARIRALAEPYGEIVKISLRPNHQGAILEYKDIASVGKASLGLEGHEIVPGRHISIGTVGEMMQQKAEKRSDRLGTGPKTSNASLAKSAAPVRRPAQPQARRGGKGGLGLKRAGVGLSGDRATKDGQGKERETNGSANGTETEGQGKPKSNADFKALMLGK